MALNGPWLMVRCACPSLLGLSEAVWSNQSQEQSKCKLDSLCIFGRLKPPSLRVCDITKANMPWILRFSNFPLLPDPQPSPKRPGIQFWKLLPPHTFRLLHLGLFNLRRDLSKACWKIRGRHHQRHVGPFQRFQDPYDFFKAKIHDTDYIILHHLVCKNHTNNGRSLPTSTG